ncbi:hypothetical protein N7470_003436 [Penicillium chermesinum]|nr:hypothetical protein N7470_003436 [Penicillium chermesinum]
MQLRCARQIAVVFLHLLPLLGRVSALEIDVNDPNSIKQAASSATWDMMTYYHGNETGAIPGYFHSWWEGAALFLALLNYWHTTGDTTYNKELTIGLQWQDQGSGKYMPANWSTGIGNDDQMFWGIAAMTAAEYKFPNPPTGDTWLTLAEGVFYDQSSDNGQGWDTTICEGGLRWQKFIAQSGYVMKNAVSNGGFMMLAARLAYYNQKDSFAAWAEKTWDWATTAGMIVNTTATWSIWDSLSKGTGGIVPDCTGPGHTQWTYNYGTFITGCAYMYAYKFGPVGIKGYAITNDTKWLYRTNKLLDALFQGFFLAKTGGGISDQTCEATDQCDEDANDPLFKGLTISWLMDVALVVPTLKPKILPKIQITASLAGPACTGHGGIACGGHLYGQYDGQASMENQITAVQVFSAAMLPYLKADAAPANVDTGGNSSSDAKPGGGDTDASLPVYKNITTGDRAGAGILTVLFITGLASMGGFLLMGA